MTRKINEILFVIHPTQYLDYDILALGELKELKKLKDLFGGKEIEK